MKFKLNMFGLILLLPGILAAGITHALDIPLEGTTGGGGGQKIAYVDMEQIFQIFPQTKYAKEDYAKRLLKKRELLADKEKGLEEIKSRIAVLETTLGGSEITQSTATLEEYGQDLQSQALPALKQDLENKKAELEEERKRATKELNAFEKQQNQIILGKIYQALKDVALEEQVTLVVDKSSILFGAADIDLTEKLQKRVRGY